MRVTGLFPPDHVLIARCRDDLPDRAGRFTPASPGSLADLLEGLQVPYLNSRPDRL